MMNTQSWIDTHCHLDMVKEDLDQVIAQAKEHQVNSMVTIGISSLTNEKVLNFTQQFDNVWGTLGIHPHEAKNAKPEHFTWILEQAKKNSKIVGIGECGFDFHYNHSDHDMQEDVFCEQMEIALELNYPLVIHTREAEKRTMKVMEPYIKRGLKGVFHSFTSSVELAQFGIDAGFFFSFNGICTFKGATQVREVLEIVPKSQLVLETDSPFLAPVPFRGKKNTPKNVFAVGQFVADFLEMSEDDLMSLAYSNTQQLFSRMFC
jgi:TatD DNase family protein